MAYEPRYDNWTSASALPDVPSVLSASRALLESTEQWQTGKTYHGMVKTLYKKVPGEASWYCRVSEHDPKDGFGFEDFWRILGVGHAIQNSEYVAELTDASLLNSFEGGQLEAWSLYYDFPSPFSPRKFNVLLIVDRPETTPKEALIIQLPYIPNTNEDAKSKTAIAGKYISIERIKERADGMIEWRCAAQSSSGGSIPLWVQEMSMPSKISDCVPGLIKLLKERLAGGS